MKRKIILSLLALFAFFASGALISIIYISNTTDTLNRLIALHKIEHLREELVINIQTVQSDLYTVRTPLAEDLDSIIRNVTNLDLAARECNSCHHIPDLSRRLDEILHLIDEYKNSLSYYITARANAERTEKFKMEAATIGNKILGYTQDMIFAASKKLEERTQGALKDVDNANIILLITLIFVFLFASWVSVSLTKSITRPISELVNATRKIASGDLGHTISYHDKTEFGELASKFNAMSIELKNVYEKITESEWRFRTLSEFSSDWEYWINENNEIVYMSPSCERITGYKQEDFLNSLDLLIDIVHPEEKAEYRTHMSDFNAHLHEESEFRIIAKDGSEKWLSHVCGPIFINDKFLGRRITNRDITDKKKLEEQLVQSQKMESLGLLSGGIAHDFNNLLTVIVGYSSLLEAEFYNDDGRLKRYLQNVLKASEQAQNLTTSLLAFSRKQIIKPDKIRLSEVIKNVNELLKRLIGEDVELVIKCSESEFPIFVDPHQLEQIIMNLATNARDAMPSGGKLTIETAPLILESGSTEYGIAGPGKYMMLIVSDAGEGMNKEELVHVFEPFFTTKEKGKGTGLGLSMVYGMVKQHKGVIDLHSEKGLGTTFKIILPAFVGTDSRQYVQSTVSESQADLKGDEVILIAEDEESVREFLKDSLESYGYKVIMSVHGEDAIKKYIENKDRIDMIILDVVMPKKDGRQVYDHLKELTPEIKALFISGYTQDILTSKGIYQEGLEFIAKPLEIKALIKKIREILTR